MLIFHLQDCSIILLTHKKILSCEMLTLGTESADRMFSAIQDSPLRRPTMQVQDTSDVSTAWQNCLIKATFSITDVHRFMRCTLVWVKLLDLHIGQVRLSMINENA
ncbi:UNVERIFIED_CONTAM: hypothetical protein K2H54_040927 [Gekko kuhli]